MKTLKPVEFKEKNAERLNRKVSKAIYEIIFKDIMDIFKKYNLGSFENAKPRGLRDALRRRVVQYVDGEFYGQVNAKVSADIRALGGTFDKRFRRWKLPKEKMPADLFSLVLTVQQSIEDAYSELEQSLKPEKIDRTLEKYDFSGEYDRIMQNVDSQFKDSVKAIGIKPEFNQRLLDALADDYNNNMKLYIKNWAEKDIKKLRERVSENAFKGARAESLVSEIQKNFGVSQRKAKFLASQETRLITGDFTKERYKSVGVTKYRWSTSNDARVRQEHRELHGKVFQWDEAVIDEQGTRGNPKEAFGCRCKAIPILE